MLLSSPQNSEIKRLQKLLKKSKTRRESNRFVIEGEREILRAIEAGYTIESFFKIKGASLDKKTEATIHQTHANQYVVTSLLWDRIAMRSGTEKLVALAVQKKHDLKSLSLSSNSLIMVVEAAEKPGNIGAILRTAAALKLDAVLLANAKTDLYNPNLIRSSLGGLFFTPIGLATSEEILKFLRKQKVNIITAALNENAQHSPLFRYELPCALVMGSEDKGVSQLWIENTDHIVEIPMSKNIDSLNLSVSAGILMYDALKQNGRLKDSL